MTADDRLIVALDVPNLLQGQELVDQIGDAVSFYKIGLGMLSSGDSKQIHGSGRVGG